MQTQLRSAAGLGPAGGVTTGAGPAFVQVEMHQPPSCIHTNTNVYIYIYIYIYTLYIRYIYVCMYSRSMAGGWEGVAQGPFKGLPTSGAATEATAGQTKHAGHSAWLQHDTCASRHGQRRWTDMDLTLSVGHERSRSRAQMRTWWRRGPSSPSCPPLSCQRLARSHSCYGAHHMRAQKPLHLESLFSRHQACCEHCIHV